MEKLGYERRGKKRKRDVGTAEIEKNVILF